MSVRLGFDLQLAVTVLSPEEFERRFGSAAAGGVRTITTAEGQEIRVLDEIASAEAARQAKAEKLIYLNHPESNVCPTCLGLHRTVWRIDDPSRPLPPLHPNCACSMEPYIEAGSPLRRPDDGPPVRPQLMGAVLDRFLESASASALEHAIGKGLARLSRIGIIDRSDFLVRAGGLRTLEDVLQRRLGITVQEFQSLSDRTLRELARKREAAHA